uniref:Uncharacterized protein n=1 Tax=Cajanus cajan TaxID=3821 RepID=A0A151SMR3_CAJCA|nr:hypothetical protein KK1_002360 [Cajanus cajan]
MALPLEWYDLVCFAIVGVAFLGALWVLWMNEGPVRNTQLWTSCWRGVHPLCLLATRFLSFLIMAVLLPLDVLEYDPTIFLYYTEYVISFQFALSFFINNGVRLRNLILFFAI